MFVCLFIVIKCHIDGSSCSKMGLGDKEWYFYCKRGRKYKNSIRPNRVTGSGFWKATGIDKGVYSNGGEGSECIGLKKTLVYYRGSAGKGSKTDWMMHEFRLPSLNDPLPTKRLIDKPIPPNVSLLNPSSLFFIFISSEQLVQFLLCMQCVN